MFPSLSATLVSYSDITGGAARATYRIHRALLQAGVNSNMLVEIATSGDSTVAGAISKKAKLSGLVRRQIGKIPEQFFHTANPVIHSSAILPSNLAKQLNKSDADVLHLHWVASEMLSIADIGKLRKPVVWTLHDMWAFCGAEHFTEEFRWQEGYSSDNRPAFESGLDLNRWTWKRKLRYWSRPMHIVTPSNWLAKCVAESTLMRDWSVTVIPNAIDTSKWQPIDKNQARSLLQLPADVPLILFGAMDGCTTPRKGFDLLEEAINHLRGEVPDLQLIVFGQLPPKTPLDIGFPVTYTGHLNDDISLQLLYSAVDALVIPSRQDNLPNTGIEASACGTPVIAFDTGGLPDIVDHKKTGYLAKRFDTEDLALGIQWVLSHGETNHLGKRARAKAVSTYSCPVVARQYLSVYRNALKKD